MKGRRVKKILLVDDDADLRDAMKTVLGDRFEIREADGKQAALETARAFKPDLMILDVMMETTSTGFELAREIKQDSQFSAAKILMLTSVDSVMNIDFKREAGDKEWLPVDDYITKPLEPRLLLEKVNNLIG